MIRSIKNAEIRIDVQCQLDDETEIPGDFACAIGEPDEDGYVEYALCGPINMTQLEEILEILGVEST